MALRSGDIAWTLFCGPFDIKLSDLTPISFKYPQLQQIKESIIKDGLINTFDVQWIVGEKELTILRGNQRYKAVKELGWEKVPCHMKIIVTKDRENDAIALGKFLSARVVSGQSCRLARQPKEWKYES